MFSNNILVSVFLLCCALHECFMKEIPPYIQVCKRDQSTIDACALKSIESLRPQLQHGIPELDVPPIDPFYIKEIKTPAGAYAKDIKVTGGENFHIKSVSADLNTYIIRAKVRFPKLHMEGRYKLNTRVLVLQIKGEGNMVADAVKCDADLVLYSEVFEKEGKEYLKFNKLDADIKIKDYRIKLDGLFNGDKTLEEATNQAINQNRGEFLRASKPYLERAVSNILLDTANKIVDGISLDELLPK